MLEEMVCAAGLWESFAAAGVMKEEQSTLEKGSFPAESVRMEGLA